MRCPVCGETVVQLWRDFESNDMLCETCLDERIGEEGEFVGEDEDY